jgi:hypothetical protein
MHFIDQFKAAHRVSTPLIAVRTFDAKSTVERIQSAFKGKDEPIVILWDCIKGLLPITKAAEKPLSDAITYAQTTQPVTADIREALRVCNFTADDCLVPSVHRSFRQFGTYAITLKRRVLCLSS